MTTRNEIFARNVRNDAGSLIMKQMKQEVINNHVRIAEKVLLLAQVEKITWDILGADLDWDFCDGEERTLTAALAPRVQLKATRNTIYLRTRPSLDMDWEHSGVTVKLNPTPEMIGVALAGSECPAVHPVDPRYPQPS